MLAEQRGVCEEALKNGGLARITHERRAAGKYSPKGQMEQLTWRGLGACITRMAPTRSPTRFACARSRPSQREGYIPQSPKVRFLGTVHHFGEYLRRKRRNFRWEGELR